jgi:hypothetical protein
MSGWLLGFVIHRELLLTISFFMVVPFGESVFYGPGHGLRVSDCHIICWYHYTPWEAKDLDHILTFLRPFVTGVV